MQIVQGTGTTANDQPTALTIGVFDGVHRGHQHLMGRVAAGARQLGGQSAVLTFDPHPDLVIHPEHTRLYLSTIDERLELMAALGVELVVVERFDRSIMALSAEQYIDRICATMALRELYVGSNFALGRGRQGNVGFLAELGARRGFGVLPVEPLLINGSVVSSTRIREQLRAGAVAGIEELLGRPYSLRGRIVQGDQRGRTIGFPTANMELDELHLLPADGVYVCRATGEGLATHGAVTNVGVRPTFAGMQRRVEAHLLDYEGDLYGRVLQLEFVERLRGEQRFSGVEALVAQIRDDAAQARVVLAAH